MNENENNVEIVEETAVEATCEAPQTEATQTCECVGINKKTEKLLTILSVAAVAVVAAAVALAIFFSTPWKLVTSGAKNSVKAIGKNEAVALMTQVSESGSTELAVDLKELTKEMAMNLEGTASLKVYSDYSKTAMAMAISYKKDHSEILDLKFVQDKENIALQSNTLLEGNAYGISLKNFVKNLEDSVFGPNGKYYVGDEVFDILEGLEDSFDLEDQEELTEDSRKLIGSMSKKLTKELKDNTSVEKEKQTLAFGDKDTKVTAVCVKMDDEQIADFMEEMVEYLRTDKQLKEYLNKHGETLFSAAAQEMDADDIIDAFYDKLDEFDENLDEFEEELEDAEAKLELTFYITKWSRQMVGVEARIKSDGEIDTKISLLAGPDLANTQAITLRVDDFKATYKVTTNDKDTFEAKITIDDVGSGKISYDKKSGEFKIKVEDTFQLAGTMTKEKKAVAIGIDGITVDGETVNPGVKVVLNAEDQMPAMPAYTDVLKMDETQLDKLVQDVMTAVQNLGNTFI